VNVYYTYVLVADCWRGVFHDCEASFIVCACCVHYHHTVCCFQDSVGGLLNELKDYTAV
jgi:hypothetical protein